MRTVKEVSRISGISVRTLHYYDTIGLLHPTAVTDAGYRLYDDAVLARLQSILLFRELQFPLKEIKMILDSPQFDADTALSQQIRLLELQRDHLDQLIGFAREIQQGGSRMVFGAFDNTTTEQYKAEVKAKWGNTAAYHVSQQKDPSAMAEAGERLLVLLAEFGPMRNGDPTAPQAVAKVRGLQAFITDHFYTCTDEILKGLGSMYTADERFRKNIDQAGGEGTAVFVQRAIEAVLAE